MIPKRSDETFSFQSKETQKTIPDWWTHWPRLNLCQSQKSKKAQTFDLRPPEITDPQKKIDQEPIIKAAFDAKAPIRQSGHILFALHLLIGEVITTGKILEILTGWGNFFLLSYLINQFFVLYEKKRKLVFFMFNHEWYGRFEFNGWESDTQTRPQDRKTFSRSSNCFLGLSGGRFSFFILTFLKFIHVFNNVKFYIISKIREFHGYIQVIRNN